MKQNEKQTEKTYLQKLEDLSQALGAVAFDNRNSDKFSSAIVEFGSALALEYVLSSFVEDMKRLKND